MRLAQNFPIFFQRITASDDLVMRVVGGLWFLLLAISVATNLPAIEHVGEVLQLDRKLLLLVARLCLIAFYLTIFFALLTRARPRLRATGLGPGLAAYLGTYLPWIFPVAGHSNDDPWLGIVSAVCLSSGMIMMVITILYLGRSFSFVPQAHHLVTTGPYRWVRHPLYLAEELSILGVVLQYLSVASVCLFLVHGAIQIRRILYEETLLTAAFPEYGAYSRSRWRLVPYVW